MNRDRGFDRAKFEGAFRIMGQYLLDRHVLGEIAIYRGSAILFQFDWRRTSEDVDARISLWRSTNSPTSSTSTTPTRGRSSNVSTQSPRSLETLSSMPGS